MKNLDTLDNKALVSSILYYDKEEIESFMNLFDKVKILDNNLAKILEITHTLDSKNAFDNLPKKSSERKAKLISLYEKEISIIPESIEREKIEDWFDDVKEYECDIELSEELVYRYCWAEFLYRIQLADKDELPFRDKLTVSPEIPNFTNKAIEKLSEVKAKKADISPDTLNDEFYSTGIPELDDYVKMRKSNFNVIAARTTIGKSLFMYNMAVYNASKEIKVLYTSLEESKDEVLERIEKHIFGRTPEECETILDNFHIYTPDNSNPDLIFSEIERLIKEEEIGLVFIDYIQLMEYPNMGTWDSLRKLTREFKIYANRNNIMLCTASQIKREAEMMGASLTTLFGSSTLEADANTIIILDNKRKQTVRITDKSIIEANISKNRSGSQGRIDLEFDYSNGHIKSA